MKNVYDYKIENDTVEAAEAAEQENPLPQFQQEKPKPVSYDEKGNIREDRTGKRLKLILLFLFVALVDVYVLHACAGQMGI